MDFTQVLGITSINILIFLLILHYIDNIKSLLAIILSPFKGIKSINRKRFAFEFESQVNQVCKNLAEDYFDRNLKVKWLDANDIKDKTYSINDEKGITVFVHRNSNQNDLTIDVIDKYVSENLYPNVKNYVDDDFNISNKLFVMDKIIGLLKKKSIKNEFSAKYFNTKHNDNIQKYLIDIESLNNKFYYFQVFLNAVRQIEEETKVGFDKEFSKELKEFFSFLLSISLRERGEEVDLTFTGRYFKYSIVLVAKEQTLDNAGLVPFLNRIEKCRDLGVNRLYITGFGRKNITNVKKVSYYAKSIPGLNIIYERDYDYYGTDGNIYPLRIVVVDNYYFTLNAEKIEAEKEVQQLLDDFIPEIKSGLVEVLKISREKGFSTKILVSCTEKNQNPIGYCLGSNKDRKNILREKLRGEWIEFIENKKEIKELIKLALSPMHPELIDEVQIKSSIKSAIVYTSASNVGKLVGTNGLNVKLASQLLGWKIEIKSTKK